MQYSWREILLMTKEFNKFLIAEYAHFMIFCLYYRMYRKVIKKSFNYILNTT